jgi:glycosyltransferase involved in cell wall biosynthesis
MRKVFFITSHYPYLPGEQFIETEIKYIAKIHNVVILPLNGKGEHRELPGNIKLDTCLIKQNSFKKKLLCLLFSKEFYLELFYDNKLFKNPYKLCKTINFIARSLYIKKECKRIVNNNININCIFYTYWANEPAYALACLKNANPSIRVITRCHGYDLYKEVQKYNFVPLNKKYLNQLDLVCPIANIGFEYLIKNYYVDKDRIKTYKLGVVNPGKIAKYNSGNRIHIVSCSFLVPVKRVHLIIEALFELQKKKELDIQWTHIGGGILFQKLKGLSQNLLKSIDLNWIGAIDNQLIIDFYKNNKIDIFLNVSESEGIPVSIMEAISFGIPVVATDVGGVSEIVNSTTGKILEKYFRNEDLINAILDICKKNSPNYREQIKKYWRENFNAQINYPSFIEEVLMIHK